MDVFALVDMEVAIQVSNLSHAAGHNPMTGRCAGTVHYCLGMTDVTGEIRLYMTRMRIGPRIARPLVGEHRHGGHPFVPYRPTGLWRPDFAGNGINVAVVAGPI